MYKQAVRRAGAALAAGSLALTLGLTGCGTSGKKAGTAQDTQIVALTTDGRVNPLGIDGAAPLFGWQMSSGKTGARQAAYAITVRDADGAAVWESGTVQDSASANIPYGGAALQPKARYTWQVEVTDGEGGTYTSEEASFETSLMDETEAAWGGAQWIGSGEMYFDAATANYFNIDVTLQLAEGGTRAAFVFGADDYRLRRKTMNIWGAEGTSYFKYEVDAGDADAPVLNIYVAGMPANQDGAAEENGADKPDYVVPIPAEALADAAAPIQMNISTRANINTVTCTINGVEVDADRQLNPLGNSQDYNSFPNVAKIGFAVPAGERAAFSDLAIHYPGKYEESYEVGDLFGAEAGATYAIFAGLDGVTVDGGTITVDGGDGGVLVCADPSYGSAPIVRTEFDTAGRDVASARLYITAQGIYEAYINGERVGNGVFNPGSEEYAAFMPYQVYDVTGMLRTGGNALGAQLAEGWWSGYQTYTVSNYSYYGAKQALLARLDVTYADGSQESVVTSPDTWTVCGGGPVRYADNYQGERYDARIAARLSGWSEAGYDASAWAEPAVIRPRNEGFAFVTRYDEQGGIVRELDAELLGEVGPGSFIYDMHENVMGVPRITIPEGYAEAGDEIIVRYAEILYPDLPEYRETGLVGQMMVENLRAAMCTDFYIAGEGEQVFEPRFTFHGYRYIEITGLAQALPAENVKTEVLSSIKVTATYESSNADANRLFLNVQNSQTSNFLSLPTDCPQRNERLGWTGDAQVFSAAASYNADVYNFYRNWLRALRADQNRDGSVPVYAPTFEPVQDSMPPGFSGTSWDAALITIPYNLYMQSGNPAIIEDNIDAIDRYLDYLDANDMAIPTDPEDFGKQDAVPELTSKTGILADWLSIEPTSADLINNAMYVYQLGLSARMAEVIGRDDLAAKWQERYGAAKAKWNELYVDPDTGKTRSVNTIDYVWPTFQPVFTGGTVQDTEASYATPLRYGVFTPENEARAVEHYVAAVERAGHKITSGFSGTPNLVPVLTEYGKAEDAYKLFEQTEYASWLYPVQNGATSVWERWNSYTEEGGFNGNNSMNSFDHFSLGAITEWMMAYQLGISPGEEAGYHRFVLQPVAGGSFTSASGSFTSGYGTITSGWKARNGAITEYSAVVPANTTADLYLPIAAAQAGKMKLPEGAEYVGQEEHNGTDCARFTLVSGSYTLKVPAK